VGPNRQGYEYEKGKYVVLKDEDFERVDLEATQTVDIQDFVHQEEIDPIFFYKPYYLERQKGGDKAYVLLRDALKDSGKVGIAKVVIKTREYLAGVKPEDGVLVLELMHFADELADPGKLHIPKKIEVGKREMNMATTLIDSMSSKWNPEKYKDDYREALLEVIEEKVEAGGKEIEEKPKKAPQADQSDRSGFRSAEKPGANWREEDGDCQIAQETEATCKESSVRWIGFSEDDGEGNRRRRG